MIKCIQLIGTWVVMLIICAINQPACGQSLASSVRLESQLPDVGSKSSFRSLRNWLTEQESRYQVSFIYETKVLENKFVSANEPVPDRLEEALKVVLNPNTLRFEKIDDRTYVIFSSKPARKKLLKENDRQAASEADGFSGLNNPLEEKTDGREKASAERLVDISVKGRVTTQENEPMPGVSVSVKGTTTGTTTDANGTYTIAAPENATLVFSFIGYTPEEIPVGNRTTIDVKLLVDIKTLSELVVTGYGDTQQRRDVTGAISSVTEKEIKSQPVTGLDQALQGRAAGVQVTQNSGEPGGAVSVRIRGVGSFGNTEPLYVIDGFPQQGGSLNNINPNEIASMEVIKDASAAAIYGSRASNGVVIITTKRGKEGPAKIEFDMYTGFQQVGKKLDVLNGPEFATLANEAYANSGERLNPAWANPSSLPSYDWQDAIFKKGTISNYNLSITGGSAKTKAALIGNYYKQNGIIVGSKFERISIRANIDHEVKSWLRFGSSLSISQGNKRRVPSDQPNSSITVTAYQMHPDQPIYNPDGSYAFIPPDADGLFYPRQLTNAVAAAKVSDDLGKTLRLLGTVFGEVEFVKGLVFRSTLGVDISREATTTYTPLISNLGFLNNNFATVSEGRNEGNTWNAINQLTFKRNFGTDHSLTALVGVDALNYQGNSLSGNGRFADNNLKTLNAADTKTRSVSGGAGNFSLASLFARVSYAFRDKYLLQANFRRDGSSRFAAGNRYGNFPSVSVGWRISQEAFMSNIPFINDLKIRASYGRLGNQNIGDYRYLNTYGVGTDYNYTFGTGDQAAARGVGISNLGNPAIRWESTATTNFGVDASFLQGQLTATLDYYIKDNTDVLIDVPVPLSFGAPNNAITRNSASIRNQGLEILLGYRKTTGDFQWNATVNFTTVKNKVISLGEGAPIVRGSDFSGTFNTVSRTEVGKPIGVFYGLLTDGLFQTPEEITQANSRDGDASTPFQDGVTPGDRRYKDLNGDGKIDADDRTQIGKPLPDFTYGINLGASFKGFDLSVFLYGSQGNQIMNTTRYQLYSLRNSNGAGVGNVSRDMLNRWTGPGTSTTIPRIAYFATPGNLDASDFYVENGSFLRCKNIQLGYTIPSVLTKRIGMERLRVYLSAQNLFTITKYTGYDPEIGSFNQNPLITNFDQGRYPLSKTFTAGINIQF